MLVAALGLVVRARPALLAPGLPPGLTSEPTRRLAPVPTPGLGIGPSLPPALVRSGAAAARGSARPLRERSRLRLSASSEPPEPPEPIALPAYPVNIYIEDTDAFAVTYYANYVRFFERAAYAWLGGRACGELMRAQGALLSLSLTPA
jgi:hypothetical protein